MIILSFLKIINKPSFCPFRNGYRGRVCWRPQSCEVCVRENVDACVR